MDIEQLRKLGLSQTEATLYLTLLKIGASEVQTIVEETGFYKANTYDALERLCEKGIISKIIDGNKRVYQLQRPEALLNFVNEKKNDIEDQEKIAKQLVKEVDLRKKHLHTTETAMVFRGFSGVRQIYSEIISKKLDYLSFGGSKESDLIGEHYWKNLHVKQKESRIKAKMIFHKSLRNWKKMILKDIIELKFFNQKFEPLTETTIYGTKVAFVVWSDNPIVTIINNEHVSNSYRQIFDMLWKNSKK
jgi:HTH-type transcriptional regulator, sugar sensing transcriptional regulator